MNEVITEIRRIFNSQDFIPLHEPRFYGNEKKYLNECIDSTFVSSVGKFVDLFEEKVALYTGATRAIVVVNGTEALHVALRLTGVQNGDEVITQPVTFIASVNAISYLGAFPVFVDVDRETMSLSPDKLNEFLTENAYIKDGFCINKNSKRKIAACVPMHTFGHPAKIDRIKEICQKYKIDLVEDAAESVGSKYKGKHTGTFGRVGILSFNGNKIITSGGGGMILTDEKKLGDLAKHLTTQAKVSHRWEYIHDNIGYNFRMPNLNAALGLAQLEQLDIFVTKKRKLAQTYKSYFNKIGIEFFTESKDAYSNYWLNAIILNDRDERDQFLEQTNKSGVMTRPIWRLMNKLPMFKNCQKGNLDNAEWLEDRVVNIPSSVIL